MPELPAVPAGSRAATGARVLAALPPPHGLTQAGRAGGVSPAPCGGHQPAPLCVSHVAVLPGTEQVAPLSPQLTLAVPRVTDPSPAT